MVHSLSYRHGAIAAFAVLTLLGSTVLAVEPPAREAVKNAGERIRNAGERVREAGDRVQEAGDRVLDKTQRITANKAVALGQRAQNIDYVIASAMALCNAEEIEVAKLAQQHAKNDKIKKFAETIIEEHQQALSKLEEFGASPQLSQAGSDRKSAAAPEVRSGTEQPQLAPAGQQGFDFLSIKREIAKKGVETAQECWNKKKPAEAEMGFVGSQIVVHQQMIDAAEVLREHASPKLRSVVEGQLSTLREHLDHAQQLIEELSQQKYASTSR